MTLKNSIDKYVPAKGDLVDEALAEYINAVKPEVRVIFIRIKPQIYYFGNVKIQIDLVMGKLNIHFGGRQWNMPSFLEQYDYKKVEK